MKIRIELDTASALDYKAFLALAQIIGESSQEEVTELPTAAVSEAEEELPEPAPQPEQPKYECQDTELPLEEPQEEPGEPKAPVETPKTCSEEEWLKILLDKRVELGLLSEDGKSVGAAMASERALFNDFVKFQSAQYGAELPKKLTPEARYRFVHEVFSHICYDPAVGFKVGEFSNQTPF